MKESLLKIIGHLIKFFVIFLALFLTLNILEKSLPKKEIQKEFEEMKEKVQEPIREVKEKISPEIELPKAGLKMSSQIEVRATTTNFLLSEIIVSGNDLYFKITPTTTANFQAVPKFLNFFYNWLYDWKKIQLKESDVKEFEKLKEILEKKEIYKRFEKVKDCYEFEIDKEKLKSGILEWKKEIKERDIEEFFKNTQKISGKIFVDEKNFVKEIEIEGDSVKIIMKIENLEEEILRKETEEMDFEKFLISIFETFLFI
jgi:hypothetical protein